MTSANDHNENPESLRHNEDYFHLLVNTVKDYAIFLVDPQGCVASWNEGAASMKGYSSAEILGRHIGVFYPPEETRTNKPDLHLKLAAEKGHLELEAIRTRKDGTTFWANIIITPLFYKSGTLRGFLKITRDITQRKKEEEKFKGLLESAPDAIVIANEEGIIQIVNQQTELLFQYSREDLIGKPVEMLMPRGLRDRHIMHRKNYQMESKVRPMGAGLELFATKQDGSLFPVEISLSPLNTSDEKLIVAAIRDITARKRADEKFKGLLESAPDAMVIADEKGLIVIVNHQAELLFNYKKEELIGQPVEMLMPSSLRDIHVMHRMNYYYESKVRPMGAGLELYATRKDGSLFPVEISLSPLLTSEGRLVVAAIRDITTRKKAEDKFKGVLESAPDAMIIADEKGAIIIANHQAEIMFNYRKEELIGQPVEMLMPASLRDIHIKHRQNYTTESRVRPMGAGLELFAMKKGGSLFPVEISLSPLLTSEGRLVVAAIRDITDRKKIEEQVRYLAKLVEHTSDAIISYDADGNVVSWNQGAEQMFGFREDEIKGKKLAVITKIDLTEKQQEEIRAKLHKHGYSTAEFKNYHRNGSEIFCHSSISVLKDVDGKLSGYVSIIRDITARKNNEELLSRFNEELAKQVTEKTAAIEDTSVQLRQLSAHLQNIREEERMGMAREIHDQLGQMLTGLKMDISWLWKKSNTSDEQIAEKFKSAQGLLNEVVKAVRRISTELHPSILDDLGLIAALEWQGDEFTKRSEIQVEFMSSIGDLKFKPTAAIGIFRIYQESLHNIAKHSHAIRVKSRLEIRNNDLILEISDDGIGFDLLQKKQEKTLGLLSMRERTLMMDGAFDVDSSPGNGTTIRLHIPVNSVIAQ